MKDFLKLLPYEGGGGSGKKGRGVLLTTAGADPMGPPKLGGGVLVLWGGGY